MVPFEIFQISVTRVRKYVERRGLKYNVQFGKGFRLLYYNMNFGLLLNFIKI